MPNPFEAPKNDVALPAPTEESELADLIAKMTPKPLVLRLLGGFEMLVGALLVLVGIVGGLVNWSRNRIPGNPHEDLVFGGIVAVVGGLIVCAGYKLTRRKSRAPLMLQIVPFLVTAFFALGFWMSLNGGAPRHPSSQAQRAGSR